ncbi:hypothetical protein PC129_g16108 [Phytophthora cactorum]|uniref:Crinkler effector protein N-terminal domain-containing protein n=1 Tax=Phytophthora cactorum TaxID=29920 RepID=A0A8T1C5P4_9STRA|nr:hypothetical protein PC111_g16394 [Phytophthora cactorum]KAG2830886.1 hypothetical protein PC112_g7491 [Phytophthora cactorum]KAG2861071.1 hypothetical protein PC113_g7488 [Phytophthora cactorum]KAG2886643.1 hypothetical protein PC114_g19157 [Phytophthora cactorum]KAG2897859.1 hypothetical protein PC115_g17013 [Phytophthora cactorum]
MVQLFCAIVGEAGSALPVKIDQSETVGDLKKAIKGEKKNGLKDVDADKLQLFLAKKNSVWLRDDDSLDAMLRSGTVDTSCMKMRASWKLNKPSLFGPGVSLGEDVVHLLVVVPEGAGIGVERDIMSVSGCCTDGS